MFNWESNNNEEQKIVGIIDFRNSLNDFLKDFGHIGYSVRPSERGKGYATEMVKLVLNMAIMYLKAIKLKRR